MTKESLLALRQENQHLINPHLTDPEALVHWLGAVQSQDYNAAKWALAQRLVTATEETIEQAFTEGKILRIHLMRPTWHFVSPSDIRWMLSLTAPRVKQAMAYYERQLGLDEKIFQQSNRIISKTLEKQTYATRIELATRLAEAGIHTSGQAMGHILMHAELSALICSGPRKGKQCTYALLAARAPQSTLLNHDEALAELTKRYFLSHGPATLEDFAWWSGLTLVDAKKGLHLQKTMLSSIKIAGKDYWFNETSSHPQMTTLLLLPNYDEYTVAYKNRDFLFDTLYTNKLDLRGNVLFQTLYLEMGK